MKNSLRTIVALLSLTALVPATRADQPTKLRELAPGEPAPDGPRERHGFVHRTGGEPRERETVAFLGVETVPVSPALTAQLGLPKGAGLVVRHIVPGSPAAGVLQMHDILLKLDDQQLIESRQFAVLVRNHKEGDEVELTYVRAAKQVSTKVKLAKHDTVKLSLAHPAFGIETFGFRADGAGEMRDLPPEEMHRVLSLLDGREHKASRTTSRTSQAQSSAEGDGFHGVSVNTGNSNMMFADEKGTLELTIKGGRKSLVAKNPAGEQLYSGAIDTPEQRAALPKEVRDRLEKIEGMQEFSFEPGPGFHDEAGVLEVAPTQISGEQRRAQPRRTLPPGEAF